MKIYLLVEEDRHFDVEVTPYADADEAIQTAAMRADPFVNQDKAGGEKLSLESIIELGKASLNEAMRQDYWIWNLTTYDDGPKFRVVERTLIK